MIPRHRALAFILLAFIALATTYSIVTPIFEAGDELWHYPFVQHLANGNGLPIQDPNVQTLWKQEGGQPPLYYVISALATFWIDTRDLPERLWRNPHARIGIPLDFGNKNMIVHTSAENFPWQGATLAVHLIRFLSILFSTITVALTYLFALEIQSDKTLAAYAAAIVAFNPMFLFISASVNNDSLATMLATLALVLLVQLVTRGVTMQRFIALGIVLGLGALTKVSLLGLCIVAAVVFAYLLLCDRRSPTDDRQTTVIGQRSLVIRGSIISATLVIVIAFWWYARNWILYEDFLAFNVWLQIAGGRPAPVTLTSLLDEFQGFRISFWGNFGGVNIIAPEWVYLALDAFTLLAFIGLLIGFARRALPRALWLPALWLVLILVLLVRWTFLTMASQGRLIFPAIAAVAVLFSYGLAQFRRSAVSPSSFVLRPLSFAHLSLVIFLFAFATLAPFTLIAPTYALPARLTDEARVPRPVHILFDGQAELVGYALPRSRVAPGDELPLTIFWRARERMTEDFSVYVRVFDADNKILTRWDAFPGRGLYPTRVWQVSEIIEDEYRLPIPRDARAGVGRIEVGLFRRVPLETLTARDLRGSIVTPSIARFKIVGQAPSAPSIENAVEYIFDEQIALIGYACQAQSARGATLSVKLYWRAQKSVAEDYTVFVHLVDANGNIIAQDDAPPQRGAYPTSFWDVGEIVVDEHALAIPREVMPGEYRLAVGMYRARDGGRLATRAGDYIELTSVVIR